MATLRQAVERARQNGLIHQGSPLSVVSLLRQFRPVPKGSVKALINTMFASSAKPMPWAVILCRFKGEAPNPAVEKPIEDFYRGIFRPGTSGLFEYWRDASLGAIALTGSKVFGWLELDIKRENAGIGSGTTRSTLVDAAIRAAARNDPDALKGFFSEIAVLTHNWAKDGAPPGADWRTKEWQAFWIDGSADARGKVTLTPPHNGNITAHEMGHGFGMQHDVSADFQTHYADPCCIMSQQNSFFDPAWKANFGPAVCVPHLIQRNWMYADRVLQDGGAWMSRGITATLAPVDEPGSHAHLAMKLAFTKNSTTNWDYYVQYVRPANWNQGIGIPSVFIRRLGPGKDIGPTPAILGSISVPAEVGAKADFVEPSGNIRFQVERLDAQGRAVQVHVARNLLSEGIHQTKDHVLVPG